jgi:hypothetical protein
MVAAEPRVRRRGFFLHSETGEPDTGEHEAAEGFPIRPRTNRPVPRRHAGLTDAGGRSRVSADTGSDDTALPQIRSGSVTGSRQRVHLPR